MEVDIHSHRLQPPAQRSLVEQVFQNARVDLLEHREIGTGVRHAAVEVVHVTQKIRRFGVQTSPYDTLNQGLIGLGIRLDATVLYAAVDVEGRRVPPVGDARAHEARVHVGVDGEPVLDGKATDKVEHLIQLAASTVHFDQYSQREVGGRYAVQAHLFPQFFTEPQSSTFHTPFQQAVVQDAIRLDAALVHDAEQLERLVHVALHAVALDDGGEGDQVRLDLVYHHFLKKRSGSLHIANASTGVNDGVVSHGVARNTLRYHHVVDAHRPAQLPVLPETLDERRVHNSVRFDVTLLLHLLEQRHGLIHPVVAHVRIQHDTVCHLVGLVGAVGSHFLPYLLALRYPSAASQRLYDDTTAIQRNRERTFVKIKPFAEGDEFLDFVSRVQVWRQHLQELRELLADPVHDIAVPEELQTDFKVEHRNSNPQPKFGNASVNVTVHAIAENATEPILLNQPLQNVSEVSAQQVELNAAHDQRRRTPSAAAWSSISRQVSKSGENISFPQPDTAVQTPSKVEGMLGPSCWISELTPTQDRNSKSPKPGMHSASGTMLHRFCCADRQIFSTVAPDWDRWCPKERAHKKSRALSELILISRLTTVTYEEVACLTTYSMNVTFVPSPSKIALMQLSALSLARPQQSSLQALNLLVVDTSLNTSRAHIRCTVPTTSIECDTSSTSLKNNSTRRLLRAPKGSGPQSLSTETKFDKGSTVESFDAFITPLTNNNITSSLSGTSSGSFESKLRSSPTASDEHRESSTCA
ncbi:transcriptional Crp Fnr family protein, putative [Babesia ovata]|uniref:Transcriptional Crp Fnr family protein, putative n=1 Tax=Babesia ovata TaxID=189622 RepID=A0A2H6KA45_9APIC|nr:transcriptional Crp Fnr family protein, putative [Babesia ovata]GBE59872.1 transcriptional Crp Fnr family protein, putative [Babesia ovata]